MNHFIIDGNNLAHRSHNANLELKTSSGMFSGMFFAFMRTCLALRKKYRDFLFIVVWDGKAKAKYEIQPDYKAGRSFLPGAIWDQVADIKTCLSFMGIDQYSRSDQEADDIIATLTEKFKIEDKVFIYSNDKDMLQLVENGKIIVYKPKVGTNPEKFYDEEAVRKEFGVYPKNLGIFRSFDGDTSDNIKGISRVPRKIVARLVNEYGNIDEIYNNLHTKELTEFQKKAFEEAQIRIKNNMKITVLNRNVCNIDFRNSSFNVSEVSKMFDNYEIKSIKAGDLVDIFSSNLNVKYSDPMENVQQLEMYNLFERT